MIGRLTGRVVAQEVDGSIVLDVGGVGYELALPLGTLGRVRPEDGDRVTVWVHTHVREDALALYGFADETDRATFRTLLGVSNVGPRIAVAVLGVLPSASLAEVIARRDLAALTGIPGIGKRIAERLLLELRDKLSSVTASSGTSSNGGPPRRIESGDERLRSALTTLGFKPSEAEHAVASLGDRARSVPLEEMLREALALLAK
ncbi:MAG: Holliday junction branch migration protein RuvA [Myxococcota bacterium]|nr:Holliday junction branch migration protein RuvA [Myxococcota bacterium]